MLEEGRHRLRLRQTMDNFATKPTIIHPIWNFVNTKHAKQTDRHETPVDWNQSVSGASESPFQAHLGELRPKIEESGPAAE